MNVATRALAPKRVLTQDQVIAREEVLVFPKPSLSLVSLILIVMLSALSLLYVKDYNRQLFNKYQGLEKNYTALTASSEKLLLAENAVISHPRLQEVAESKLNMHLPLANEVVVIQ